MHTRSEDREVCRLTRRAPYLATVSTTSSTEPGPSSRSRPDRAPVRSAGRCMAFFTFSHIRSCKNSLCILLWRPIIFPPFVVLRSHQASVFSAVLDQVKSAAPKFLCLVPIDQPHLLRSQLREMVQALPYSMDLK